MKLTKNLPICLGALAFLTAATPTAAQTSLRSRHLDDINNSTGAIFGGVDALPGEFPFFVHFGDQECGGSLISKNRVLTAAHCIEQGPPDTVFVNGEIDLGVGVEISVVASVSHPNYDPVGQSFFKNDVAVLLLGRDVNQRFVTLNENTNAPPVDSPVITIGFGRTDGIPPFPDVLQKMIGTSYRTISNSECGAAYDGIHQETVICVQQTDTVSSCNGDSGGPLLDQADPSIQYGIVSGGSAICADASTPPDVYTVRPSVLVWLFAFSYSQQLWFCLLGMCIQFSFMLFSPLPLLCLFSLLLGCCGSLGMDRGAISRRRLLF